MFYHKKRLATFLIGFFTLAAVQAQAPAKAETFPSHLLKIVVPFAPGGPADALARPLAEALSKRLGQSVIVENRPGANAAIASQYVARSAPDGYTLLLASDAGMSLAPATQKNLPYDPARDFAPVSMVAQLAQLLFVSQAVPAQSLKELIALAKKSPRSLAYASIGMGSQSHVATEAFKREAGIDIMHVPYPGAAPAITDVMADRVQVMISSVPGPLALIRSGRLRAIAYAGPERSKALPDVPTFTEAGVPGFESRGWFGIVAPAKTPPEVLKILSENIWAIVRSEPFASKVVEAPGFDVAKVSPEAFPEFLVKDRLKWKTLVAQQPDLDK